MSDTFLWFIGVLSIVLGFNIILIVMMELTNVERTDSSRPDREAD